LESTSSRQRHKLYEYFSAVGGLMLISRTTIRENPDNITSNYLKDIAQTVLYSAFKLDIEKLHITQEGEVQFR
jgi:hypothetical protein